MQKLILRHCYLEEARFSAHECMRIIQGAPQLKELSLLSSHFNTHNTPGSVERFWSAVASHSSLVKLCMDQVFWMDVHECLHLQSVSQAPRLEVLSYAMLFTGLPFPFPPLDVSLLAGLSNLKKLHLGRTRVVGLDVLVSSCPMLQELSLSGVGLDEPSRHISNNSSLRHISYTADRHDSLPSLFPRHASLVDAPHLCVRNLPGLRKLTMRWVSACANVPLSQAADVAMAVYKQALVISRLPPYLVIDVESFELGRTEWASQYPPDSDRTLRQAVLRLAIALSPLQVNLGPCVRKLEICVPVFPAVLDILGGVFPNITVLNFHYGLQGEYHIIEHVGSCLERAFLYFPRLSELLLNEAHLYPFSGTELFGVLRACFAAQHDPRRDTIVTLAIGSFDGAACQRAIFCREHWEQLWPRLPSERAGPMVRIQGVYYQTLANYD